MIGLLLALCFAAGVGLLIVGLAREPREVDFTRWREQLFVRRPSVPLALAPLGGLSAVLAFIGALLVWSLVGVPVLALAAAVAGAYAPVAWARRMGERARRERQWKLLYGGLSAVSALLARRLATRTWGILTGERPPAKNEAKQA